jgi:hypothetical protein
MITILPLFYQIVLRYTASAAGIAISPRGVGSRPKRGAQPTAAPPEYNDSTAYSAFD